MIIGRLQELFGTGLEHGPAALFDLRFPTRQLGKEVSYLLLHCGLGPKASVGCYLLTHPAPDCLVSIEVRAVTGRFTKRRRNPGVVRYDRRASPGGLANCPKLPPPFTGIRNEGNSDSWTPTRHSEPIHPSSWQRRRSSSCWTDGQFAHQPGLSRISSRGFISRLRSQMLPETHSGSGSPFGEGRLSLRSWTARPCTLPL